MSGTGSDSDRDSDSETYEDKDEDELIDLTQKCNEVEEVIKNLNKMDDMLKTLKPEFESLYMEGMNDLKFLHDSRFRYLKFAKNEIEFCDLSGPVKFKDFAKCLRNYLMRENLIDERGLITVNEKLAELLSIQVGRKITYPHCLKSLNKLFE